MRSTFSLVNMPTSHGAACPSNKRARAGFTMMELLTVITIVSVVMLAALTFMGSIRAGEPVERAAEDIRALIQRGKANALANRSRFELLVEFEKNVIYPIERRAVAFFGFESQLGAGGRLINLDDNSFIEDQNTNRLDGRCLNIGGGAFAGSASATIPASPDYNPLNPGDGVVVSFDFHPRAEHGEYGTVISKGMEWQIQLETERKVCYLRATVRGQVVESRVPVPTYAWSHVELNMSPYSIRLYVNHIPSSIDAEGGQELNSDDPNAIVIGGQEYIPMYFDNLRVEQLIVDRPLAMPDESWLVPPGGKPQRAADGDLYRQQTTDEQGHTSAVNVEEEEGTPTPPLDGAPIPRNSEFELPVRRAMIFFDDRGQLDLDVHSGPLRLVLAGQTDTGFVYRHFVDISIMGVVTHLSAGDAPEPEGLPASPEAGGDE